VDDGKAAEHLLTYCDRLTKEKPIDHATQPVHQTGSAPQDRIVELWDVGQTISKDSPNENGMF
jgi:hypothetical protein